jgi:hypothetical protein
VRRRLFALASLLSLLLCVASAALWIIDVRAAKNYWFIVDQPSWPTRPHWVDWSFSRSSYMAGFDGDGLFCSRDDVVSEAQIQAAYWPYKEIFSRAEVAVKVQNETPLAEIEGKLVYTSRGSLRLFPTRDSPPAFSTSISPPLGWERRLTVSMLIPAIAFLLLPAVWAKAFVQQRRRRRAGLCATCSYDLTANTSGICPECGTPIPTTN